MSVLTKIVAGGVAVAALATAAPAAAQYYPNPYGYGNGGNVVGQVLNQVLGGGAYGYGWGPDNQVVVSQCVNAVQARLNSNYGGGYNPYGGGYNPYGYNNPYNGYGRGRVLGISRVEPRNGGGLTIRGVASSGMPSAYGNTNNQIDLTFRCRSDYRGYITSVNLDRAERNYGYQYAPYDPYAQYGYRRY
jgi:hypothetical protein